MKEFLVKLTAVDWKDWRVRWILGAPAVAIVISIIIYEFYPEATDATKFAGALFASWVSGLAITVFVTLIISIVTLARPDQDVFEARARNLLRRQTGPHIDYIIQQLQKILEPYCDVAYRVMEITEYDEKHGVFRINQTTINDVKSYLNDMPVKFDSEIVYADGTPAPEGRESCSLTFLKVQGEEVGASETFKTEFRRKFDMLILPNRVCRIEHRMVYWVKAGEEQNRHRPTRYTNALEVIVKNHLPSKQVIVVHPSLNGKETKMPIDVGGELTVVKMSGLEPGDFVYDFNLVLG